MQLKDIVSTFIRLKVILTVPQYAFSFTYLIRSSENPTPNPIALAAALLALQLLPYTLLWIFAQPISAYLTKGLDGVISFQSLKQEHVYVALFIIGGFGICLSSISSFVHSLVSLTQFIGKPHLLNMPEFLFSNVVQPIFSLAIGLTIGLWLILKCRKTYDFLKKIIEPSADSTKSEIQK